MKPHVHSDWTSCRQTFRSPPGDQHAHNYLSPGAMTRAEGDRPVTGTMGGGKGAMGGNLLPPGVTADG